MYPSIKLPLMFDTFQFRLICDDDTALAVRPVGDGNTGITGLLGITGLFGITGLEITGLLVIGCTNVDVSPEV
ncbi:hypothetical protein DYY66_1656 [Candidatus Nitrosotalea sp. FS]|nr:hypothetical protein [Candidatus Nitrosotalea sp. FS]